MDEKWGLISRPYRWSVSSPPFPFSFGTAFDAIAAGDESFSARVHKFNFVPFSSPFGEGRELAGYLSCLALLTREFLREARRGCYDRVMRCAVVIRVSEVV